MICTLGVRVWVCVLFLQQKVPYGRVARPRRQKYILLLQKSGAAGVETEVWKLSGSTNILLLLHAI